MDLRLGSISASLAARASSNFTFPPIACKGEIAVEMKGGSKLEK